MKEDQAYSASEDVPKEKLKVVASKKKLKEAKSEVRKATALVASMEKAIAEKKD